MKADTRTGADGTPVVPVASVTPPPPGTPPGSAAAPARIRGPGRVRRLLAFLLGNWPLKLGAVALATVLYGGVVLSQNTRTWPGQVPIDVHNPPRDAAVLNFLGYVTNIQFRAPLDVASHLAPGSFFASIDLSGVEPNADGSPVEVPVSLGKIDASVEIVDYQPKVVEVTLDPVVTQSWPVTVERGQIPDAVTIGPPQVDPQSVTLTGAKSRVASVHEVAARVTIDATGLNVDQEVDLQALDDNGTPVLGVQIEPSRARVRIDVARNQGTLQLPVRVQLTGAPAPGFEIGSVTVLPAAVTVSGEAPVVGRLSGIDTLSVDLASRNATFAADIGMDVPPDVTVDGSTTVHVVVTLVEMQVSRTLEVGPLLHGAHTDLIYTLDRPSVLVTVSGPRPIVDNLEPSDLIAELQVTSLAAGSHLVDVGVTPPTGVQVDAITPTAMQVDIVEVPRPTPAAHPEPPPLRNRRPVQPQSSPSLSPSEAP